jgi:hypothetical protein
MVMSFVCYSLECNFVPRENMSSARSSRMNLVVDVALRLNCTLLFCLNVVAKSFIYVDVLLWMF